MWLCARLLSILGIAHLYTQVGFQNCYFSACSLYRKTKTKREKTKRKEKKRKERKEIKRSLDLSIVWELKLEVLVFGITFMLDWELFPIAPLFAWLLSYLSICSTPCPQPITTLKSPSDLDPHVFLVWLLVLEACQVCWCLFFRGALKVNSSLEIWVIKCIFRDVMLLSILSLSWNELSTWHVLNCLDDVHGYLAA